MLDCLFPSLVVPNRRRQRRERQRSLIKEQENGCSPDVSYSNTSLPAIDSPSMVDGDSSSVSSSSMISSDCFSSTISSAYDSTKVYSVSSVSDNDIEIGKVVLGASMN